VTLGKASSDEHFARRVVNSEIEIRGETVVLGMTPW
jgi:hypothetical protein